MPSFMLGFFLEVEMKKRPEWILPDLKEAQKRTKKQIERIDSYVVPENARSIGVNRLYFISTYGCQANERDSETLAGIMDSMGFTKVEDVEKADVILINTCAIRDNAMEKVLGEIGNFKRLYRDRLYKRFTEFPYYKVYFKLGVGNSMTMKELPFPYYKVYFKLVCS